MKTNTFEGGTDGTALTSGNTGGASGDALSIQKGTTSSINFATAAASIGSMGARLTHAAGEANYVYWTESSAGTRFVARRKVRINTSDGAPTAGTSLCQIRNTSAGQMGTVSVTGARKIYAADAAATITGSTSTTVLAFDTDYWLELAVTPGATTSTGLVEYRIYAADGTTALETFSPSATHNTGLLAAGQYRFGRPAASTWPAVDDLDNLAAGPLASGWLGASLNSLPVVTVAPSQVVIKGALATIAWTATDSDGTIASCAITRTSGPGTAPTLTSTGLTSRTLTPTTQGVHVYSITATDNLGGVSVAQTHTLYVTDTTARPDSVVDNSGVWTNEGGAASIQAALADASTTTFAASPDNPTGKSLTLGYPPLGAGPISSGPVVLRVDNASPARSCVIDIMEGATVRATRTVTPTTSWVDYAFDLTSAESTAVVDHTALRTRLTAN